MGAAEEAAAATVVLPLKMRAITVDRSSRPLSTAGAEGAPTAVGAWAAEWPSYPA